MRADRLTKLIVAFRTFATKPVNGTLNERNNNNNNKNNTKI